MSKTDIICPICGKEVSVTFHYHITQEYEGPAIFEEEKSPKTLYAQGYLVLGEDISCPPNKTKQVGDSMHSDYYRCSECASKISPDDLFDARWTYLKKKGMTKE